MGLPEVLVGLKVHLAGDTTDRDRLERYLVSYGGKTVAEYQLSLATHIVYSNTCENNLWYSQYPAEWYSGRGDGPGRQVLSLHPEHGGSQWEGAEGPAGNWN